MRPPRFHSRTYAFHGYHKILIADQKLSNKDPHSNIGDAKLFNENPDIIIGKPKLFNKDPNFS